MPLPTLLPLTEEERARHLIKRLDAAEDLVYKQLTHAKAVLVRAGMAEDTALLGAVLAAIVATMQRDGTEQSQAVAAAAAAV